MNKHKSEIKPGMTYLIFTQLEDEEKAVPLLRANKVFLYLQCHQRSVKRFKQFQAHSGSEEAYNKVRQGTLKEMGRSRSEVCHVFV